MSGRLPARCGFVICRCRRTAAWAALAGAAACTPTLDWRDVRPAGTALALQFPCRPVTQQRALPLAGAPVQLSLLACSAGGQTWALAHADTADPQRVGAALDELRHGAVAKLQSGDTGWQPLAVPGATPNERAGRGRLVASAAAGGRGALQMELLLFAHGTQVFQASVLGERLAGDAVDNFFGSARVVPPQ